MTQVKPYKYLSFLIMFYIIIQLLTFAFLYQPISFGFASTYIYVLFMPLCFVISGIIAEVYGYQLAKEIIYGATICQFIFVFAAWSLSAIHSAHIWSDHERVYQTLADFLGTGVLNLAAMTLCAFMNIYLINKWKSIFHGKYFWLRCLVAAAMVELCFASMIYASELLGHHSIANLFTVISMAFIAKLLLNPIFIIPASFIVAALKKLEDVDDYRAQNEILTKSKHLTLF